MTYALLLFIFGVVPMTLLWLARSGLVWPYKGSLLVIVILILLVSIPWEMLAIDRVWYYSPRVIWPPACSTCRSRNWPSSSLTGCWWGAWRC